MNVGKGWLIIEYSIHENTKHLVSMINPRRTGDYIQKYLEHIYVDKFASIEEKIAYKKNPASWPYKVNNQGPYTGIMDCGHDHIMTAYYCHKLNLKPGVLQYTYKILKGQTNDLRPIFKEVTDNINVT